MPQTLESFGLLVPPPLWVRFLIVSPIKEEKNSNSSIPYKKKVKQRNEKRNKWVLIGVAYKYKIVG